MAKLAFLISAHKDPIHLKRLIDSLPESSEFFIHIDAKSDIRLFTEAIDQPNAHFIEHRVNVCWGSINEVEYQMELVRAALAAGSFDYLITLSGMDYPVWSNSRIFEFFDKANGKIFLQGISMLHQGKLSQQYAKLRFFTDKPWANGTLLSKARNGLREAVSALGVRKTLTIHCPDKEYTLYKGAAWWAITPDLALDVLNQWDNNEHLVGYFKTSFCPAETFVQTVAFNSPKYADRCMLAQGRYKSLTALTPLTFIDYSTNIKILDEFDFDRITKSGKMFCRKVVTGESDLLMTLIDDARKETGTEA